MLFRISWVITEVFAFHDDNRIYFYGIDTFDAWIHASLLCKVEPKNSVPCRDIWLVGIVTAVLLWLLVMKFCDEYVSTDIAPRYIESSEGNADSSGTGGSGLGVNKSETHEQIVNKHTNKWWTLKINNLHV